MRYGNPDMQILGTLKIKMQLHGFLNAPSINMGSDFVFRVAIYLQLQIWLKHGNPETKSFRIPCFEPNFHMENIWQPSKQNLTPY